MENLFLIRYPEEPVIISPKKKTSIGRAKENDIRLTEARVSRKHAVIGWLRFQQAFSISDLGSLNGTFLNGTKIPAYHASLLHDKDKIRIASAVFTVRIATDPADVTGEFIQHRRLQEDATQIVHLDDLNRHEPGFAGDLAHLCPVEVFQTLDAGSKTGELFLKTPAGSGSFLLSNGKIAEASFGDLTGENAVYASLRCNTGTFAFTAQEVMVTDPDQLLNTAFLLIEGCRLMDEESNKSS